MQGQAQGQVREGFSAMPSIRDGAPGLLHAGRLRHLLIVHPRPPCRLRGDDYYEPNGSAGDMKREEKPLNTWIDEDGNPKI